MEPTCYLDQGTLIGPIILSCKGIVPFRGMDPRICCKGRKGSNWIVKGLGPLLVLVLSLYFVRRCSDEVLLHP